MGKAKKTKKFADRKRLLSTSDPRLKTNQAKLAREKKAATTAEGKKIQHVTQLPSSMFLQANTQLGPPYRVIIDTNFINFSLQNKIEIVQGLMDTLYAAAIPCVTDCVLAELEKLGSKYRVALRVARDPRFERLPCSHKGTYADDCIVHRVQTHKCYLVATCDRELRRRLRQVPGVPLINIQKHRYAVERLPDQGMAS